MNITITRHRYSKYGVDSTLSINGQRVCDTCEHPDKYLTTGTYRVIIERNKELRRKVPYLLPVETSETLKPFETPTNAPFIRIGNGPFKLLDGSIIVGKSPLTGLLIHSAEHFNRLIDRLDKAKNRGDQITLTIQ